MIDQLLESFGNQYAIYPNPVSNADHVVNIDLEYGEGVNTSVQIFTLMGELMYDADLYTLDGDENPIIPIHDLSPGMYIVRINYGILIFSEKLMVE